MFLTLFVALLFTIAAIHFSKPFAHAVGLVDAPCVRKRHEGAIPLIGGVTIYAALAVTTVISNCWGGRGGFGLILLGLPILIIGMLDDRNGLSPRTRFFVEIVCCFLAAIFFEIQLEHLGELIPGIKFSLGFLAIPFTVLGLVGVINAFNMTDGVDGLAGGLAFLIFSALAILAHRSDLNVALQLATFAASILGFLVFNSRFFGRARAAIFMGDAGTLFIGFAIGWYLILLSQGSRAVITPAAALWLFATPLFDTVSVMTRRILRGQSPFHADREHLHHIFLLAGFGVNGSVLIILCFQLVFIAYAFASLHFGIPEWVSFLLFLVLFAVYYWTMSHAWRLMKRIKQFREWAGFDDRRMHECVNSLGRRSGEERRKVQMPFSFDDRRKDGDRRQKDRRDCL